MIFKELMYAKILFGHFSTLYMNDRASVILPSYRNQSFDLMECQFWKLSCHNEPRKLLIIEYSESTIAFARNISQDRLA